MRNTKSHSEFMNRKAPHNTCANYNMETPKGDKYLNLQAPLLHSYWEQTCGTQGCADFSVLLPSLLTVLVTNVEFGKWLGISFYSLFSASLALLSHLHSSLYWEPPASSSCDLSESLSTTDTHTPQELVLMEMYPVPCICCYCVGPPKTLCPSFFQCHLQLCPVQSWHTPILCE